MQWQSGCAGSVPRGRPAVSTSMAEASVEEILVGRVLRLDRRDALRLLRDLARDRAVLADLRRLWAEETATSNLYLASDERVLTQLAERIAAGSLAITHLAPQYGTAPPPGAMDSATEA